MKNAKILKLQGDSDGLWTRSIRKDQNTLIPDFA